MFAGMKTQGVQAQRSTIWPLDRAEIKEAYTNYLPLEQFLRKWNSGCAVPGFCPPPVVANPGASDWYFGLQKIGSQTINQAMLSRLYTDGVIWVPRGNPTKKKWDSFGYFFCFFLFFFFLKNPPPPTFVSKEVFIKWYIYMPNICGTGPAVWGDFFPGEGAPTDACSKYGKYFP